MSDDLVERLKVQAMSRMFPSKQLSDGTMVWHPMMLEAADEITRLREENARLRAALKPFAEMELWTDAYPDGPLSATTKERFVDPLWIVAARTAIREGGKDE